MWLVTSSTWAPSMPGAVDLRRFSPTTTGGGSLGAMLNSSAQPTGVPRAFFPPPPAAALFCLESRTSFQDEPNKGKEGKVPRDPCLATCGSWNDCVFCPFSLARPADRQTCLGRLAGCPTGCRGPACCNGLLESLFVAIHPSSLERFAASPPSASCNATSAALASSEHAALKSFLGWLTSPAIPRGFPLVNSGIAPNRGTQDLQKLWCRRTQVAARRTTPGVRAR